MNRLFLCSTLLVCSISAQADWLQFRGPNSAGSSTESKQPAPSLKIDWAADLPGRGLSTPIIVGERFS